MRLNRFRVQNYKIISDTDWIKVDPSVTALVGKNESGKTAILRALWKTRNVSTATTAKFDKLKDYPLDRYTAERDGTQEVTALEFKLGASEASQLAAQLGLDEQGKPETVTLHTYYVGKSKIEQRIRFEDRVEASISLPVRIATKVMADALHAIEMFSPPDAATPAS